MDYRSDSDIKEGWAFPKICDILQVNYGKGLKKAKRMSGSIPVYGSNGVVGAHNVAFTQGPTIIIGRKGTVGAVSFSDVPCWPIDTTYFIDEFNDLDPKYIVYALKGLNLTELDTSTAIPGLNRNDIYNQHIPLPPIAEQKRIVAKVEELLARVNVVRERLPKVKETLRRFRQSVLAAACSGRLTADWRNLNTTTAMQTMSNTEHSIFGSLPENWKVVHVHEVATVKGGKRLPKGHQYSKDKSPFPYLRVTDFEEMSVATNELKYVTDITRSKIGRYTISQSDVYISIAGSIGMVGLIPEQLDGASLTENAAKLTELKDITKEFLCYALNSQFSHDQITRLMTSSGQPKLALFRIKKILITLPPIDEQLEVTNRVEAISKLADVIEKRVAVAKSQAERLPQAILAKAFRAELVPTEAELARLEGRSYEPASTLLAKIKAQRKGVKPQRKRGRALQRRNNISVLTS